MALGKISFYGPPKQAAEGRREISPEEIVRSSEEKSHSGPFGEMTLEDAEL